MSANRAPRVVCVLGMHRSGTSLVTRIVNLLGFGLGAIDHLIVTPPEANPRGYWENELFNSIDERLLARLGGSWHDPPPLPPGWEHLPSLADLSAEARTGIDREFSSSSWAWKDPRSCLTLPFWQRLLPESHYVIVVRDPLSVAASLAARDGFSLQKAEHLWLVHVAGALAHTAGKPRLILSYDELVEHADGEVRRLAAFLDRRAASDDPAIRALVSAEIDTSLRHHAHTFSAVLGSGIGAATTALHLLVRHTDPEQLDPHTLAAFSACAVRDESERTALQAERADFQRARAAERTDAEARIAAAERAAADQQRAAEGLRASLEAAEQRSQTAAAQLRGAHAATEGWRREAALREDARAEAERALHDARQGLQQVTNSFAFRVMSGVWRLHAGLAPPGTRRDRAVRRVLSGLRGPGQAG